MTEYKTYRIVDGKPRWVFVDEHGNVINNSPSSKELKDMKIVSTRRRHTDEELLNYLEIFYKENGRVPTNRDFHK